MKLTYWISLNLNDATAYNIRGRTKGEVVSQLADTSSPYNYGPPLRVTVEYQNALDLVRECLREGGGYWETD